MELCLSTPVHVVVGDLVRVQTPIALGFMRPDQLHIISDRGESLGILDSLAHGDPTRLRFRVERSGVVVAIKVIDDSDA